MMTTAPASRERDRCKSSRIIQNAFGQKPFGLSLSKAFPSLGKEGERFDKLTANGVLQRLGQTPQRQGQKCSRCC
jgi:hypothetical protein